MTQQVSTNILAPLRVNEVPSDFVVSGVLSTGLVSGALNYKKFKDGDLKKNEAIKSTIKTSSQAGLATGVAIASVQYIANKNYLKAALSLALGAGAIYAIEKYTK